MPVNLQLAIKHTLDRVVALSLLILLSPLLAIIALLIVLDSQGPVLFVQERIGWRGLPFLIYKFRSMVKDADELLDERGRVQHNRVTRVGKWLRLLSLDELPQLLNIAKGEMSFVGPRPTLAEHFNRYTSEQRRRIEAKPGITGLAQVSGRNSIPWSRRIELDIEYLDNYSLWLDCRILGKTVKVVLFGTGIILDRNPEQMDDLGPMSESNFIQSLEKTTGRSEPAFVGAYKKDLSEEEFLKRFNQNLAEFHDQELQDLPERWSAIHVIGAPRSGTTVTTQLLASCIDIGYINNLIAAFWRAPVYGIRLSNKLLSGNDRSSFESTHGRTHGICEPHEFGYFWSDLLGYRDMKQKADGFGKQINWNRVHRVITNMTHAFGKPVLFKSFLLAWHMQRTLEAMPNSLFLWVRRNPADTALSLLHAREKQLGSISKWISMRPREYEWLQHEPPAVQVAGQVYYVEQAIEHQVQKMEARNVVQVSYEQLCRNPATVIEAVQTWLRENGQEVKNTNAPPVCLNPSTRPASTDPYWADIQLAIERIYEGAGNDRKPKNRAA